MMSPADLRTTAADDRSPRPAALVLAGIVAAFLLVRLPLMFRTPGGIDEEFFAVPGLTILDDGVPKMPPFPSRNPRSVMYRADRVAYCVPPLYFYATAAFFAVLPPVYGTARLCSACAAILGLILVYDLARRWTGSRTAALWSAGLLSVSIAYFDYGTRARPDMLCTLFGLLAVWSVQRWRESTASRWLAVAGVALGLGGLTHPFAIAYAVQVAVWVAWCSRGRQRLGRPALLAGLALAVFALWVPVILIEPDTFRIVSRNQYGASQTDSFAMRLLWPWPSLAYHYSYLKLFINPWQFVLALVPLTIVTLAAFFRRGHPLRPVCRLGWSSIYLLCALAGSLNMRWGYFTYPAALLAICTGAVIAASGSWLTRRGLAGRLTAWAAGLGLVILMIPGSHARILAEHLQHWNDVNYNAPRFARELMETIPAAARCTVDKEFLLDFYASGRPTLAAEWVPFYFSAEAEPYDYFLCGRYAAGSIAGVRGSDDGPVILTLREIMCGELVATLGNRDEPFACFAEVFRPSDTPCPPFTYAIPEWIDSPPAKPWNGGR